MSGTEIQTLNFVAISGIVLTVFLLITFKAFGPLPYLCVHWVTVGSIVTMAGAAFISFPDTTLGEAMTWRAPTALVLLTTAIGLHVSMLCRDMPTYTRNLLSLGTLAMAF